MQKIATFYLYGLSIYSVVLGVIYWIAFWDQDFLYIQFLLAPAYYLFGDPLSISASLGNSILTILHLSAGLLGLLALMFFNKQRRWLYIWWIFSGLIFLNWIYSLYVSFFTSVGIKINTILDIWLLMLPIISLLAVYIVSRESNKKNLV